MTVDSKRKRTRGPKSCTTTSGKKTEATATREEIDKKRKQNLIKLSWWILEQKLKYYHPEHGTCVDDHVYDEREAQYKKLCKYFNQPTTATDHVGFPHDRPCGRLVISKMQLKKK